MYAYRHPKTLSTTDDWVHWAFRLRRADQRHALEFVEGWNTTPIAISGTVPWLASSLVGILWAVLGGDTQTAFTVASFILTSSSSRSAARRARKNSPWLTWSSLAILTLLAIISSIESSAGPSP